MARPTNATRFARLLDEHPNGLDLLTLRALVDADTVVLDALQTGDAVLDLSTGRVQRPSDRGEPMLLKADCGHRWVATMMSTYACPVCGRYDGDHHLTATEPIVVRGADTLPVEW